jgi:hypothetical protein
MVILWQLLAAVMLWRRRRAAEATGMLALIACLIFVGATADWINLAEVARLASLAGRSRSRVVAAGLADSQFAQQVGLAMGFAIAVVATFRQFRAGPQSRLSDAESAIDRAFLSTVLLIASLVLVIGHVGFGLGFGAWSFEQMKAVRRFCFAMALIGGAGWCCGSVSLWRSARTGTRRAQASPNQSFYFLVCSILLLLFLAGAGYIRHFRALAVHGWP